jgi:prephenate dehydrogenase
MKIGVIGCGAFGCFFADQLAKKADVVVTDVKSKKTKQKFVSLEEALNSDVVVLAVPMNVFENTLNKIKNKLKPGTIIMDVCSLKMFSCKAMDKILPKNVEIIGTHPLFGPQTGAKMNETKLVMCEVRAKKESFTKINNLLSSLGPKIIITTPEEHDKQMAVTQDIIHFIGHATTKAGLKRVPLDTKAFDKFMDIVDVVECDSPALFHDMHKFNPYSASSRKKFIDAVVKLDKELQ